MENHWSYLSLSENLCWCFACICISAALCCCTGIRWCCPHLSHPSPVCCCFSPLLAHLLQSKPPPLPVFLLAVCQHLRHAVGKGLRPYANHPTSWRSEPLLIKSQLQIQLAVWKERIEMGFLGKMSRFDGKIPMKRRQRGWKRQSYWLDPYETSEVWEIIKWL